MKNTKKYGAISKRDYIDEDDNISANYVNSRIPNDEEIKTNTVTKSSFLCNCNYIVEPVAFIYNLASSIISITLGQFIYNKILNRLIDEQNKHANNTTNFTKWMHHSYHNISLYLLQQPGSNISQICASPNTTHNSTGFILNSVYIPLVHDKGLSPEIMNRIQTEAQEQTANLYFEMALYSSIPVIIMTNLLGVNCSNLGRKCLMLIYLSMLSLRYLLFLLQCIYPAWPDYLFLVGAILEGMSGGSGVLYLAFFSYISDLTSARSRSFRISLLGNINTAASLCTLYACGIVIKYYGYFHLFLTSVCLILSALLYTIFLVPETLVEIKHKNIFQRIRSCSVRKCFNCFKVYFNEKEHKDALIQPATGDDDDNETFLLLSRKRQTLQKQTWVLLTIVLANFIYVFGANGIGSIFTLFIMNSPFCFDSIEISKYSVFSTFVQLVFSMIISKFLRINDLIICCFSVLSLFSSVFFYIYGNSAIYIYAGALVSSIAGLQCTYARSIVSKSVAKSEVSDALCLVLLVDTFIAVLSNIVFPVLYSKIVSKGITLLFWFSNFFILIALLLNIICFCLYKPKKDVPVTNDTLEDGRLPQCSNSDLLNESLNAANLNSSGMVLAIKQ